MALPESPDDKQLLKLLKQEGEPAIDILFRRHYASLCRTALRIVADEHVAEDLVQEVFFELWRKRENLLITTSFKAYLHRAARNKALNFLRDKKWSWEENAEEAQLTGTLSSAAEKLEADDLQRLLDQAVKSLPERCRVVFALSRYEQLSYQEIADALNISTKTVENQISKALKILRKVTQNYLPTGSLIGMLWHLFG